MDHQAARVEQAARATRDVSLLSQISVLLNAAQHLCCALLRTSLAPDYICPDFTQGISTE